MTEYRTEITKKLLDRVDDFCGEVHSGMVFDLCYQLAIADAEIKRLRDDLQQPREINNV